MKTIIAGSRNIKNPEAVKTAVNCAAENGIVPTEIVSGGANGVDSIGEQIAKRYSIPVKRFSANWAKHGMAAGPIRNGEMAKYAEALIAVWDGESKGTADMIKQAAKRGLTIYIHIFRPEHL